MVLGNAEFRVRLFLFRARRDDTHGCRQDVGKGREQERKLHSLQGGAPTVGALGDAALDENRWAINLHFQLLWV